MGPPHNALLAGCSPASASTTTFTARAHAAAAAAGEAEKTTTANPGDPRGAVTNRPCGCVATGVHYSSGNCLAGVAYACNAAAAVSPVYSPAAAKPSSTSLASTNLQAAQNTNAHTGTGPYTHTYTHN